MVEPDTILPLRPPDVDDSHPARRVLANTSVLDRSQVLVDRQGSWRRPATFILKRCDCVTLSLPEVMCYVDELQRYAGYDSEANQNVYAIFRDTNREVLAAFDEIRVQSVPTAERLNECLDEYSPIDAVSVSAKRVEYYCTGLVDTTV